MGNGKNYETVHRGKMLVNLGSQDSRRAEVEEAVRRATASFPDVLDLVPDFGLLAVLKEPGRDERAVLA